jgi:hypothetical protein
MPEPGTTIAGAGAVTKALTAIKDFPLWLLTAIALFLVACPFVPVLSAAVPQEARKFVILGAGAFTILAVCRLGSLVISAINKYRADREARRTFHLTPISQRSYWGPARQKDGTIVSQIHAEFMAKNRTDKLLHLLTARVVRPKIAGEVVHVLILTGADSKFDVDCLPPGATMRISANIMIRGHPGRVRKNPLDLAAVVAVVDDEGNEQRVKLPLKAVPVPLEDTKELIQRLEDAQRCRG